MRKGRYVSRLPLGFQPPRTANSHESSRYRSGSSESERNSLHIYMRSSLTVFRCSAVPFKISHDYDCSIFGTSKGGADGFATRKRDSEYLGGPEVQRPQAEVGRNDSPTVSSSCSMEVNLTSGLVLLAYGPRLPRRALYRYGESCYANMWPRPTSFGNEGYLSSVEHFKGVDEEFATWVA